MKPEVLLGCNSNLLLEPQCKLGSKCGDISLEIAGARDVNTLAGDFISHILSGQAPRDAREHRSVEPECEKRGTAVR